MRIMITAIMLTMASPVMADEVVEELSRRSLIPVEDLVDYLANCDRDQLSMNFCAFRDAVDADLRLEKTLSDRKSTLSATDAAALDAEMSQWREDMAAQCNQQADDEAEGCSMRPAVFSFCVADATEQKLKAMGK